MTKGCDGLGKENIPITKSYFYRLYMRKIMSKSAEEGVVEVVNRGTSGVGRVPGKRDR